LQGLNQVAGEKMKYNQLGYNRDRANFGNGSPFVWIRLGCYCLREAFLRAIVRTNQFTLTAGLGQVTSLYRADYLALILVAKNNKIVF